ncbi:MAG: restriction endonuclease [Chitinophagales bacterium]
MKTQRYKENRKSKIVNNMRDDKVNRLSNARVSRKFVFNNQVSLLQSNRRVLICKNRIKTLMNVKPGNNEADKFHEISFDNLIHIFGARLSNPYKEVKINEGRKRIDIVFNNNDNTGFFRNLNQLNKVHCPKILIECKNYGKEIGNPEFDQLVGRFSQKRGQFGILLCRSIEDKQTVIQRCKDILNDKNSYVIVLSDEDIITLLGFRETNNEAEIDNFLTRKLDELIM